MTVVTSVIQGLTVSAQSGPYGIIMHIIATGTFVLVAGLIYRNHKSKKKAIIALIAGALFDNAGWVAFSAYVIGVLAIIVSGIMLKKFRMFAGDRAVCYGAACLPYAHSGQRAPLDVGARLVVH